VVIAGLGKGGFADIVQVVDTISNENFAMKVIAKKRLVTAKSRSRLAIEHRALMKMAPSPFVLQGHACFESPTNIFFVTDLCLGGNLFSFVASRCSCKDSYGLSEDESRIILAELALAIEHVHGQGYIHKDIKMENVMFDSCGHVKLVDFGFTQYIRADVSVIDGGGTLAYMSPEWLRERTGGRHTDWWAYGVIAFELTTGCAPWSTYDDFDTIIHEVQFLDITFPDSLTPLASAFLKSLMDRNYETRLGTRSDIDVRQAEFFECINWKATELRESTPAFVPRMPYPECEGSQAVLESYISKSEVPDAGDAPWYAGFDFVAKKPSCRITAKKSV